MKNRLSTLVLMLSLIGSLAAQLVPAHAPTSASATQTSSMAVSGKPVARVNGAVLTDTDLLREEYAIFPYARQHNGIPKDMEPQIRKGAMQMIIFEELVYQEARRRKMTVSPAKLQHAEADFRSQFSSNTEYQEYLQREFKGSKQALRGKISRSLLIDALLKSEVDAKSAISPVELKGYYEKNPSRFQYQESFAIQTISFIPPQKATPQQVQEARKRAENTLPQAKAAKDYEAFGMLAEKVSEDDYRVMMGDHKAMDSSKLAPQVLQALLKMQAGQVTDVIEVGQIYTIVRLNKHVPSGKMKFEDVKEQLGKELEMQKTNQIRAALDKKLRQNAKIEEL